MGRYQAIALDGGSQEVVTHGGPHAIGRIRCAGQARGLSPTLADPEDAGVTWMKTNPGQIDVQTRVDERAVRLLARPDWTSADRQFGVCTIELEGTRSGNNRITGTHRWSNCTLTNDGRAVGVSGSFEMQRQ